MTKVDTEGQWLSFRPPDLQIPTFKNTTTRQGLHLRLP